MLVTPLSRTGTGWRLTSSSPLATGSAEWDAALLMLDRMEGRKSGMTLAADKAYDTFGHARCIGRPRCRGTPRWNDGLKTRAIPEALDMDLGYRPSERRREVGVSRGTGAAPSWDG